MKNFVQLRGIGFYYHNENLVKLFERKCNSSYCIQFYTKILLLLLNTWRMVFYQISRVWFEKMHLFSFQSYNTVDYNVGVLSIWIFSQKHSAESSALDTMGCSKTQRPDFPPKGSGNVLSNFLLSAGILAQYKTFHVSFKKYLYFQKDFSSSKVEK